MSRSVGTVLTATTTYNVSTGLESNASASWEKNEDATVTTSTTATSVGAKHATQTVSDIHWTEKHR
ncbi:MAG: hypothetical protein WAL41_06370 [Mycobacterium sp.]